MIILKLAQALHRPKKDERGFTLIELIVVMAILAILAAIAIPMITGQVKKARVAADKANVRMLYGQVNLWAIDNTEKLTEDATVQDDGWYKGTGEFDGEDPKDWVAKLIDDGYLTEELKHPFGGEHCYLLQEVREGGGDSESGTVTGYIVKSSAEEDFWGNEEEETPPSGG